MNLWGGDARNMACAAVMDVSLQAACRATDNTNSF